MILVDTSVWISHFKRTSARLQDLLLRDQVLCHPFIIGELALGNLPKGRAVLDLLNLLPPSLVATHQEVLSFVEIERLAGRGIGWIDAHLLASARLESSLLWTEDKALAKIAAILGVLDDKR